MENKEWFSLREAADALGISEVSARRWVKSGKLEAAKPGQKYAIPRRAIEELMAPVSPKGTGRASDPHNILREQLHEHGIEINNSEAILLAQYVKVHQDPPGQIYAVGYVKKADEPVDPERVKALLAYVIAAGLLSKKETEQARETLGQELATA